MPCACCPRGAVFSARERSFPSVRQLLQDLTFTSLYQIPFRSKYPIAIHVRTVQVTNYLISQTITTYIWSIYAVYIYVNNTIVLHKTVSESAAQYPSDHSSTADSRWQESQTHCFEDLLGSQHTLSCRRKEQCIYFYDVLL